ncbi:hypothetical protein [Cronobacter dublinensis]|uniref:hypothetical protein n=1 Tax=Cronobacter dublinensis TaxID=413497 RepID=UPI0006ACC66D|nr:hypothetical protein [Cronobacter dublinensis]
MAILLLNKLKNNPENHDVLRDLHKLIIRGVTRQERLISLAKKGCKRLSFYKRNKKPNRDKSNKIKELIENLSERITQRKRIIFLYKCFGDGIAHIYQSMYALKHLYYDKNYSVKEDAGYISGKSGFIQEWKVFLICLKNSVPAVMSDITNTIRNGDVCLLGGEDPFPIEVKLTKHANPRVRVRRQIDDINEINEFFRNDYAPMFRGVANTYRVPLVYDHVNYIDDVNHLAMMCKKQTYAYKEVEKGLFYSCMNTNASEHEWESLMDSLTKRLNLPSTLTLIMFANEEWDLAYPFTLSLSPKNLIRYIYGEFVIFIMVDLEHMRDEFSINNLHATFLMDGNSAIQFCKDPNDLFKGVFRISQLAVLRHFISFLSLDSFVKEQCRALDEKFLQPKKITKDEYNSMAESGQIVPEDIVKEWSNVKDCLRD